MLADFQISWKPSSLAACCILFSNLGTLANETEIPGYTEAIEKVEVAAKESGLLQKLNVKQGDIIEKGEMLATLDDEIQKSQLAIATHLAASKGDLARAESELNTKERIFEHFKRLSAEGFAQEKEIIRAKLDVETAQANVMARREKIMEYQKRMELAMIQLQRRKIVSPITGQVMEVHRSVGEFVPVTQPKIVTIVQTSPVRGKFQIRLNDAGHFKVGNFATVKVAGKRYIGKVESIGLVATSETVPVCISIENKDGFVKLGQKCTLVVPESQFTSANE